MKWVYDPISTTTYMCANEIIPEGHIEIDQCPDMQRFIYNNTTGKWEERLSILETETRQKRNTFLLMAQRRIDRYRNESELGISTTDTATMYADLLQYVQDLRVVPDQPGFPTDITWPTPPWEVTGV